MPSSKTFPAITGGCVCGTVRYRLLTSPLFCYACHCTDCRAFSGSAFGLFLKIEMYNVKVMSSTLPAFVKMNNRRGAVQVHAQCSTCRVHMWVTSASPDEEAVYDVRVGTLDFPDLMVPDLHIFTENKLGWIRLPDDAHTLPRGGDIHKLWPKSSLERLDQCNRWADRVRKRKRAALVESKATAKSTEEGSGEETGGEGDKTPTALAFNNEDDEEFEKKFKEKEKILLERLEKLQLKLKEEEVKAGEQKAVESAETDAK
ncbi:hypothetical protein COCC4DRAFT_186777 [Bipolaris maydis ATCC 48331]|uniref:CENP-V/GFA domain-containing protein n=2 Tax=Cochliobolus heterostrophus TaxID=5016 RepID=M2URL1_COCH5|nr:uncharacterized protein COCC4DRAFT_186777 [Bipolaris maydis ATCC 48331]EMD90538.1 hypothetical protein COCHEDRAFT_1157545 [Bipolaris maydis C5]KAH7555476.1 hypothetical protein BM1_07099 [Bipolaris maydis]ENI09250.1 hypothetical protein COCC4DRAFT_186777 [Bipolaris maydis ATCC 48331]KAJ5023645.1 Mss4-like protein [Bipolaris maydis]KAJ5058412.1 Mss4-like protein [Bipolaris maydis]